MSSPSSPTEPLSSLSSKSSSYIKNVTFEFYLLLLFTEDFFY